MLADKTKLATVWAIFSVYSHLSVAAPNYPQIDILSDAEANRLASSLQATLAKSEMASLSELQHSSPSIYCDPKTQRFTSWQAQFAMDLRSAPEEFRSKYFAYTKIASERALAEALKDLDVIALESMPLLFPATPAAKQALMTLLQLSVDNGSPTAVLYAEVIREHFPTICNQDPIGCSFLSEAYRQNGESEIAAALATQYPTGPTVISATPSSKTEIRFFVPLLPNPNAEEVDVAKEPQRSRARYFLLLLGNRARVVCAETKKDVASALDPNHFKLLRNQNNAFPFRFVDQWEREELLGELIRRNSSNGNLDASPLLTKLSANQLRIQVQNYLEPPAVQSVSNASNYSPQDDSIARIALATAVTAFRTEAAKTIIAWLEELDAGKQEFIPLLFLLSDMGSRMQLLARSDQISISKLLGRIAKDVGSELNRKLSTSDHALSTLTQLNLSGSTRVIRQNYQEIYSKRENLFHLSLQALRYLARRDQPEEQRQFAFEELNRLQTWTWNSYNANKTFNSLFELHTSYEAIAEPLALFGAKAKPLLTKMVKQTSGPFANGRNSEILESLFMADNSAMADYLITANQRSETGATAPTLASLVSEFAMRNDPNLVITDETAQLLSNILLERGKAKHVDFYEHKFTAEALAKYAPSSFYELSSRLTPLQKRFVYPYGCSALAHYLLSAPLSAVKLWTEGQAVCSEERELHQELGNALASGFPISKSAVQTIFESPYYSKFFESAPAIFFRLVNATGTSLNISESIRARASELARNTNESTERRVESFLFLAHHAWKEHAALFLDIVERDTNPQVRRIAASAFVSRSKEATQEIIARAKQMSENIFLDYRYEFAHWFSKQ